MKNKIIKFAGLIMILVLASAFLVACGSKATPTPQEESVAGETAGKPGPAIDLTGDATAGATVFTNECATQLLQVGDFVVYDKDGMFWIHEFWLGAGF